jgi:cytochrome c-type biogenesis protein CcmE
VARSTRSPARLVIALSVAAVLAVFLLYTSIAGGSKAQLRPSTLAGHTGDVSLTGKVVGKPSGDAHTAAGLRFRMRDIEGASATAVPVVFHGTVPDLFKSGRDVVVEGRVKEGVFVANSLVTKCPSKYAPAAKPPVRAGGPVEGVRENREVPPAKRA